MKLDKTQQISYCVLTGFIVILKEHMYVNQNNT
jgi:hypothetical protein